MHHSILIAQIHSPNIDQYVSKIRNTYNDKIDRNLDLIIFPNLPHYHGSLSRLCALPNNIRILLQLTLKAKTYILVDGVVNSLPGTILLIGFGKVLSFIRKEDNIITDIGGITYNISFGGSGQIGKVNINIFPVPYPYFVMDSNCLPNSIYVNQIGGYNELVFTGESYVTDAQGNVIFSAKKWQESLQEVLLSSDSLYIVDQTEYIQVVTSQEENDYQALVCALRDYVNDHNFVGVVLGLSGGIDSALSMVIAADALGHDKVRTVMMPSCYTSNESINDAMECAEISGVQHENIPINELYVSALEDIKKSSVDYLSDKTQENLQSRIRGVLLMAISNNSHTMVLATGNKSELYTGYCTLYGDTCGGYAILKDLYKTRVYELSKWRNANIPCNSLNKRLNVIPQSILTKAPTAELRPNQKDTDTLPEYDVLDSILRKLIDQGKSLHEVIDDKCDAEMVKRVLNLFLRSEFKRVQSPVGPKISNETKSSLSMYI